MPASETFEDHYDDDDELDPFEEAASECGSHLCDGYIVCSLVGSEHCDLICPFRDELGSKHDPGLCDHESGTLEGEKWICDDCGEELEEE